MGRPNLLMHIGRCKFKFAAANLIWLRSIRRKKNLEQVDEEEDADCSDYPPRQEVEVTGTPDPEWKIAIQHKLEAEPTKLRSSAASKTCCIHRLPNYFHRINDVYAPRVVSIGPLHRGAKRLKAMEEHKWRYMRSLLSHDPDESMDKYLMAAKALEQSARDCYSETIYLSSNDFIEMMVVDGCFIIDLVCKAGKVWDSDPSDPVLNNYWFLSNIMDDLLKLENQIPFFVLQCLFDLTNIRSEITFCLTHLLLNFFQCLTPDKYERKDHSLLESQQLLHLFHCNLCPVPGEEKENATSKLVPLHQFHCCFTLKHSEQEEEEILSVHSAQEKQSGVDEQQTSTHSSTEQSEEVREEVIIPNVTELHGAGLKFQKKEGTEGSFLDIRFKKGILIIPQLNVQDHTNSLFLNLIALEQFYTHCPPYITSYTKLMDQLINNANDVGILRKSNIIRNWLGSDEEVADLFNKMGKEIFIDTNKFYFKDVAMEINRHYNSTFNMWRAILARDYFNNPWSIISVVAAAFLLLLTVAQTFLTLYPYLHL